MAEQFLKTASVFLLRTEMTAGSGVTGVINRLSCNETVSFMGLDQAFLMINEWLEEEKPFSERMALRTFQTSRRTRLAAAAAAKPLTTLSVGSASAASHGSGCAQAAESGLVHLAGHGRRGDARRKEAFLVRIICRQHNSWQGEVCWKAQRLYFRSTLELMCLIHSALDPGAVIHEPAVGSSVRAALRVM